MGSDVLGLDEIDRTHVKIAGGKGANLGELSRIEGIEMPAAFCVTAAAYRRVVAAVPSLDDRLDALAGLTLDDLDAVRMASAQIRQAIEDTPVPEDLRTAIIAAVDRFGRGVAFAVRSSATAEDLSSASFAGQQDTSLDVVGSTAVLEHVRRCWASLFTDRAVTYRIRNGFDHRRVHMAVVVQEMVFPRAAGVVFTADPVTSNRTVTTVEASSGLGEALVSGRVNPDTYRVRDGRIIGRSSGAETGPAAPSGTAEPALTDEQVVALAQLGRRIEAHFGEPQDIEWCLDDDGFHIVQSRPITTLFPIPDADDDERHVYLSVGHQQMMTDPMTPLGLSVWQLSAGRPMYTAGGRLFVDVARELASPAICAGLLEAMGRSDPLMRDALETVVTRGFIRVAPDDRPEPDDSPKPAGPGPDTPPPPPPLETDPAIVADLIEENRASVAALAHGIRSTSGSGTFDFILDDLQELKRLLVAPRSSQVIMAGMEATWWINDHLHEWLGDTNVADALTRSAPDNVSSEMGLALLDVADAIRPHPGVVSHLRDAATPPGDDDFLDGLVGIDGGPVARAALVGYLDRYGMRCVGEIDIARPRWRERPVVLLPLLLAHVDDVEPGDAARRFDRGREEAERSATELLERLRAQPDGAHKAEETERMIDRVRTLIGFREHPKYGMISRYDIYKQALMREADRLADDGVIDDVEDVYFLTFPELHEVVRSRRVDAPLIRRRRDEFPSYGSLRPPRILTSDGETFAGAHRREDVPPGALAGLAISGGTVEGRARVVLDMAGADLEPGDILVTEHTDPSWSPLFVAAAALVTEVGGLMTHGAVVAREYGLPAVVGVERATRLIRDGQRIRVDGTAGWVEIVTGG